jgi:hypothetical protein
MTKRQLWKREVDATGSELCPVSGFVISHV